MAGTEYMPNKPLLHMCVPVCTHELTHTDFTPGLVLETQG